MPLPEFFEWLAATPSSTALRESHYLYLAILATHVLTLTVFLGTAIIVDLRLLGLVMTRVPVSQILSRLLPWTTGGFVVMAASGALMFYASPSDRFVNLFFRTKMAMLVLAGLAVWIFFRTVHRGIGGWDNDPVPPRAARLAGGLTLMLWVAILVTGRMIPYQQYWFD
ncbi:MAG: hypothetical protein OXQ29_07220 [Rhodospirillaceae bacterium]|nr:hypothetical protein [Rhodospirillaceae bacterium]